MANIASDLSVSQLVNLVNALATQVPEAKVQLFGDEQPSLLRDERFVANGRVELRITVDAYFLRGKAFDPSVKLSIGNLSKTIRGEK